MFYLHNISRSPHTASQRRLLTADKRGKKNLMVGLVTVRRGRPVPVSAQVVRTNIRQISQLVGEHRLKVTDANYREVDVSTLQPLAGAERVQSGKPMSAAHRAQLVKMLGQLIGPEQAKEVESDLDDHTDDEFEDLKRDLLNALAERDKKPAEPPAPPAVVAPADQVVVSDEASVSATEAEPREQVTITASDVGPVPDGVVSEEPPPEVTTEEASPAEETQPEPEEESVGSDASKGKKGRRQR